jgi:N-acyl amino acid synthase of PEP-CTERM/exosortase system
VNVLIGGIMVDDTSGPARWDAIPAISPPIGTGYFECIGVNGRTLLAETYRARYRVFCEERGFLDGAAYPEHQETDGFDTHSVHVLARHRSGEVAGTARLILQSEFGFPCQAHCQFYEAFSYLRDFRSPRLANYSEVSRLAVSKQFRRRAGDSFYGGDPRSGAAAGSSAPEQRADSVTLPPGPEIFLCILKFLYQETKRRGISHWLIAVERSLHVTLRRMGWPFVAVGPEVNYYGPVRPYLAEVIAAERSLSRKNPMFFSFLREGLRGADELAEPRGCLEGDRLLRLSGI